MNNLLQLLANRCIDAAEVQLEYRSLPSSQIISGAPRVGSAQLGWLGAVSIGVWEMSPSVTTDVEVDEFFIVLSGRATVAFTDGTPELLLKPGTVGRLSAGTATVWSVSETLRKIYVAQ